jgi:hypothetical protein
LDRFTRHRQSCFVSYKSTIFPDPSHGRGGLITHTSQLVSLIVSHLDINISRRGRRSSDRRCFNLFGDHGLQVNVDFLVFEDTETALDGDSRLVRACWTENTY